MSSNKGNLPVYLHSRPSAEPAAALRWAMSSSSSISMATLMKRASAPGINGIGVKPLPHCKADDPSACSFGALNLTAAVEITCRDLRWGGLSGLAFVADGHRCAWQRSSASSRQTALPPCSCDPPHLIDRPHVYSVFRRRPTPVLFVYVPPHAATATTCGRRSDTMTSPSTPPPTSRRSTPDASSQWATRVRRLSFPRAHAKATPRACLRSSTRRGGR